MNHPRPRPPPKTHKPMKPPSPLLLAMEGRAMFEWASYGLAWPWLKTAPRGDGHPVLVLPGLVAGDRSTYPLRRFLSHLGYEAYPWQQGLNVGPRDHVIKGLLDRVRSIQKEHEQKVTLIGWSLGGAMANALALRMPERIRQVVTLGSPLTGHPKGTNAWRVFEMVSGFRADDARLMQLVEGKPTVPTTSIMSKTDGIVNWRMSLAQENSYPSDKFLADVSTQGELEALTNMLASFGYPLTPPAGWQPSDPNKLLLPEERAASSQTNGK